MASIIHFSPVYAHFYTPAFKNVGVLCYINIVCVSVHLLYPFNFVCVILLKPMGNFNYALFHYYILNSIFICFSIS